MKCRLCGKDANQIKGVLIRVNEKGTAGIWECRPICGTSLPFDAALGAAIEGVFEEPPIFGLPLSDCSDVEFLRSIAEKLWDLLDDIDTVSDMVKSNDAAYRKQVERIQRLRGNLLVSDGYKLFLLPNASS